MIRDISSGARKAFCCCRRGRKGAGRTNLARLIRRVILECTDLARFASPSCTNVTSVPFVAHCALSARQTRCVPLIGFWLVLIFITFRTLSRTICGVASELLAHTTNRIIETFFTTPSSFVHKIIVRNYVKFAIRTLRAARLFFPRVVVAWTRFACCRTSGIGKLPLRTDAACLKAHLLIAEPAYSASVTRSSPCTQLEVTIAARNAGRVPW